MIAEEIAPGDIVVSLGVRFTCRYGCKGYGKHPGCLPYVPSPGETRRMVNEYSIGLLLSFEGVPGHGEFGPDDIPMDFHPWYADLITWVNGIVDESIRRTCRHMDLVRPSREAAGIDVVATAGNLGWKLSTIPCRNLEYGKIMHSRVHSIGLVLIE